MTPEEDVLMELKELREQVTRLQRRCMELLEENRGIRYAVREFHLKMKYPVEDTPHIPDDYTVRFRLALVAEEAFELFESCLAKNNNLDLAYSFLRKAIIGEPGGIAPAAVDVDICEFADASVDLDYVVEGSRLTFGIDGGPLLREVHRANMDKSLSHLAEADRSKVRNNVAKARKPPGWRAPDILGVLKKQGL